MTVKIVLNALLLTRKLNEKKTVLKILKGGVSNVEPVDTPLAADWLQVCFGSQPDSAFSNLFRKNTNPALNL